MRTVRFLVDRTVKRARGPTYEKGSVHTLREDQVRHWLNRGVVELVPEPPPNQALTEPETEQPPKDEVVPTPSPVLRKPWEVSSGNSMVSSEESEGENISDPR